MSKTPTETQPAERRAYRVNEFCQAYRVSRDTAYKLMRSGKLKYFSVGTEPHFGRGRRGAGEGVVIRHGPSQTASMTRNNKRFQNQKNAPQETGQSEKFGQWERYTTAQARARLSSTTTLSPTSFP
jgi:hypothetical protein